MNKIVNKIMCFVAVLVLCVPLLCFSVNSEEKIFDLSFFKGTDFTGQSSSTLKSYLISQACASYDSISDFEDSKYCVERESDGAKCIVKEPYFLYTLNERYYVYENRNDINFFLPFALCYSVMYNHDKLSYDKPIYYLVYNYTYSSSDPNTTQELYSEYYFVFSNEPFNFSEYNSTFNCISFSSDIVHAEISINLENPEYYDTNTPYQLSFCSPNTDIISKYLFIDSSNFDNFSSAYEQSCNRKYYLGEGYNFIQCYSNFDFGLSQFGSYSKDKVHTDGKLQTNDNLSDSIDVKLTPEFGIDMDRIYDKNTGQNDYFKLEVTNNSDTNIQFYCAIVDSGKETLYNDNGQISKFLYRDSYWNYIYDCDYYQLAQKTESKYLGFQTLTKFYINKLRGNFFWVLLKPGEHFEDYIYWENVKILPSTSYDFVLEACPTNNDIACDSFVSSSEQLEKQFYFSGGSKEHWWTISEDVELDQSVEQYSLDSLSVREIYRVNFSVLTIPTFSSNVRGGNAKITSGWEDTQKQASNPYYKQNLMTGNVEPVNNYQEFKIDLDDVDVDLDNVGVDSVKEYINYSQNFFKLIKMSFQTFPSLWVLVVFGLTAIIVIAIVRYVRG